MAGISVNYSVHGLKELDELLAELPSKIGGTVLRQAVRDSALPARNAAVWLAPISMVTRASKSKWQSRYPGMLKDNIIVKSERPKAGNEFEATATVGLTKQGYYGFWVEFGSVHNVPHPFIRPAADATREESVKKFADYLRARIVKAHEKLRKAR